MNKKEVRNNLVQRHPGAYSTDTAHRIDIYLKKKKTYQTVLLCVFFKIHHFLNVKWRYFTTCPGFMASLEKLKDLPKQNIQMSGSTSAPQSWANAPQFTTNSCWSTPLTLISLFPLGIWVPHLLSFYRKKRFWKVYKGINDREVTTPNSLISNLVS